MSCHYSIIPNLSKEPGGKATTTPTPPLHEKKITFGAARYQTPDSVLAGWPEEVNGLAEQIYSDFNKEHGTDYKFQLKK